MKNILILFISIFFVLQLFGHEYSLHSPDNSIQLLVSIDSNLTYKVLKNKELIVNTSKIGLKTNHFDFEVFKKAEDVKISEISVDHDLVWGTSSKIKATGNKLTVKFSEKLSVEFVAFNDGIAWRFVTAYNSSLLVYNELAEYNFDKEATVYFPEAGGFSTPFEANFLPQKLSKVAETKLGLTPLLVKSKSGKSLVISEVDLFEYPGMFVNLKQNGLEATFPNYPASEKEQFLGRMRWTDIPQLSKMMVDETESYIAKTQGTRTFPWRSIQIANEDKELLTNDLIALLAQKPNKTEDYSWVKPGKVVWDWYHKWNLQGVDFKPDINTATYKYLIDFAVNNNLEYVNIDDGWCDLHNFKKVNKHLNLPEVLKYAEEKGVGIFLWATWQTIDENMIENLNYFKSLGIAGLKVDFFDRCDQRVVDFVNNLAAEASKRNLLLNLHGMYKPSGLQVTYPNVVNFEGVLGLEYNKFSDKCTPTHNLTIPFTRNVVGPMDYTPGSMRYVSPEDYKKSWSNPHSMSTRAQQLAMYVIYHGGIQMLADSPTMYEQDQETMEFLQNVPVTWDETIALQGALGKAVAIARRSGDDWYIAAMTAENKSELSVNLDFISKGNYQITTIENGELAEQLKTNKSEINNKQKLIIKLNELGGFVAHLHPLN